MYKMRCFYEAPQKTLVWSHRGHLSAAVKVEKPVLLYPPLLPPLLVFIPSSSPSGFSLSPLLNDLGRSVTSTSWSWLEAEPRAKFAGPLGQPAGSVRPLQRDVASVHDDNLCDYNPVYYYYYFFFLNHKVFETTPAGMLWMSQQLICNSWLGTSCFFFCFTQVDHSLCMLKPCQYLSVFYLPSGSQRSVLYNSQFVDMLFLFIGSYCQHHNRELQLSLFFYSSVH